MVFYALHGERFQAPYDRVRTLVIYAQEKEWNTQTNIEANAPKSAVRILWRWLGTSTQDIPRSFSA